MLYTIGTEVILEEANALKTLAQHMPEDFEPLVDRIIQTSGRLVLSGIGKSGYIARKISASFASTGTPSMYVHPAEASHGDLGIIAQNDLVMLLSVSGETSELLSIIKYCKRYGIGIIGMTMREDSTLAEAADYLLKIPTLSEVSNIGAPTTSAIMMLALGDALMVAVYESKGFTKEDFKVLHPGGKIGVNLLHVSDIMHRGDDLPIVSPDDLMSNVLITMTQKRFGCAVVCAENKILGIITDGDLRRHMNDGILSAKAVDIMTKKPRTIKPNIFLPEALAILNNMAITSLIVAEEDKLLGIVHIHDLLKTGVG